MDDQLFTMSSVEIARVMGTVGSPLIVISELIKNAVDASAKKIDIYYNRDDKTITVFNDQNGFSSEEIQQLSSPGVSEKKLNEYLTNENGMYLTGSKGLGLLSVFLICDCAEIYTAAQDKHIRRFILDKSKGSVSYLPENEYAEEPFTKIILKDVNEETINLLSSESEVRKLRHICTYLYKGNSVPFPKMKLHILNQEAQNINFSCNFPSMLYDVRFAFQKDSQALNFQCLSPGKHINDETVVIKSFQLPNLQEIMLQKYSIKETISTRTNENCYNDFSGLPTFEGRILVYERNLAGAQLKAYGAGVNIYVNEFALYNYLAEENDWLGLADFSQRKKATRLKPHNVFGYVNFPEFNEHNEQLQISNERADFIQDITFNKLMYLLKGVIMFAIFNIDVADKNPQYKALDTKVEEGDDTEPASILSDNGANETSSSIDSTSKSNDEGGRDNTQNNGEPKKQEPESAQGPYSPDATYKPAKNTQKGLRFTKQEGSIIDGLKDTDDLSNKIYNLIYELSVLNLQTHRHSIAYLYRALLESSTKYLSKRQSKVTFSERNLETSIVNALNYFGNISNKKAVLTGKEVHSWRDVVTKRKLIDMLNQYVHNEQPVDALLLQETWNTMKGYVMACLSIE